MKKGYIVLLAISLGVTLISFILMFLPTFYYSYSSSTMYISGYGSSTSKSGNGYIGLFEASAFLAVVCLLFTLATFPMLILALIMGAKEKPKFILFLFLGFIFSMIPGFSTFFAQFTLGSSSTNGQAGAWHSTSTHVEFGAAGGWFTAFKVISFLLLCLAIVVGVKMKNEFVTYRPKPTYSSSSTSSSTSPRTYFKVNDYVKLISPFYTSDVGTIPANTKGEIVQKRDDGKYLVKVTLSDKTTKQIIVGGASLAKDAGPHAVSISTNDKEIPSDINYDYDHLNYEANYCSRCGRHTFVKYPSNMVCYNCRKAYSFEDYSKLPISHKDDHEKWNYYPDVLKKYRDAISEETSNQMKEKFGLDKNEYYDFIDKDFLQEEIGCTALRNTDIDSCTAIFSDSFFLLIPKMNEYELELLSDPLGSLKKYFHKFDCIKNCQYVKTEKTHMTDEQIANTNSRFLKYSLDKDNNIVEHIYNIHFKGISGITYLQMRIYDPLMEGLKKAEIPIDKEKDKSFEQFEKKYGVSWEEFQKDSLGKGLLVGHDKILTSEHYCVSLVKSGLPLFIITQNVADEGYKAAANRATPNFEELDKYLFTPKDIFDVQFKHEHYSSTIHHKASVGDMLLGDLAFGEAGMLAAAVANNYDTTLTSDYYHLFVTFKANRLNGITLEFLDTKPSGNEIWDIFLQYKDIGSIRAKNEVLKELEEEPKKEAPAPTPAFSVADEIKKYKELLDCGAITQEEYDAKKKQLLDL